MARVHVASVFERRQGDSRRLNEYKRLLACVEGDTIRDHEWVGSPGRADLILFAELADDKGFLQDLIEADPVYRKHREISVLFNPRMKAPPKLPGIYGSAYRSWCSPGHALTSHYLETALERDHIQSMPQSEAEYLYSFCGSSRTWTGRSKMLRLEDDRALLIDSGAAPAASRGDYEKRYVDSLRLSRFVLCPRGIGPASLRLFEVLRAGRVPVIVADSWQPPSGPDWDSFSVTVPEAKVEQIPAIVRGYEDRWESMAAAAIRAHEEWFSAGVSFSRIVDWALELQRDRLTKSAGRHRRRMRRAYQLYSVRRSTRALVNRVRQ